MRKVHRFNNANRDRVDIIASILEAANGGATGRRILLMTGLSHNQFKKYIRALVKGGYLRIKKPEMQGRPMILMSTDKGLEFLFIYEEIKKLLPQKWGEN